MQNHYRTDTQNIRPVLHFIISKMDKYCDFVIIYNSAKQNKEKEGYDI